MQPLVLLNVDLADGSLVSRLAQKVEADFVAAERLFRLAGPAYSNMRLLRQWV